MTDHLIYPTIDLYLYDLRQGLGQDLATLKENELVFLNKLPPALQNKIKASPPPEKMEWETEFVQLLTEEGEFTETLNLPPEYEAKYEGYYYPVQLSDTYALMVDCSVSNRTSPTDIQEITTLKKIIVDQVLNNQGGSLGQTWLISGTLPSDLDIKMGSDDVKNLAQKCYNLLVGKELDCQEKPAGEGKLLGGRFFEWNPHNLNDTPKKAPYNLKQNNPHVIIILYPNLTAMENAAELIDHWMQLFCHRHKILWAYVKSRVVKRDLEAKFVEVQSYVKDFKTQGYEGYNLSQLSQKVSDADNLFSDYAINLSYLEFQRSTIEVNLDNYRQQLKELVAKVCEKNPEYEVKCLEQFHSDARNKYLKQVRKDSENLSAGLKMLEVAVNLIRVNLQVREAKSDRTFQNTLGIVGAGLAAASVTASISGQFPNVVAPVTIIKSEEAKTLVEQNLGQVLRSLTIPESALMPFISLFLSLIIGLIGAGLTGLVIRLLGLRNHGKKR
ncbi:MULTISPECIES: hypothetical protein [Planktothrix]|jgi:hypothetical protein|uniref:Uncharacterized protein n=1 Tax=Planktothrix rubescens CCAP 1459/22 TaxID=329571 RepID=A0A6J7ZJE6_PLARU|nr:MULTISPECIES: hypothetical protein [Planktothrix]CAC5341940.1 conserved hypothetical protein [Planktothrix rubescens NIVA-CYA 18]CAD5927847.1 hypothetical protein PCC7821_01080 [Planktothrix rubescens NIVA-CYA 18]